MKRKRLLVIITVAVLAVAAVLYAVFRGKGRLVITGIVTTDDVIVSPEISGRIEELRVKEGDAVTKGQVLALIQPAEWRADLSFYRNSEHQSEAQQVQAEADLRFQEAQEHNQVLAAKANLAAAEAQVVQADADLIIARLTYNRQHELFAKGTVSAQDHDQARATLDGATARSDALRKQVVASRAALAIALAGADQTASRRAALEAERRQVAAAAAQADKAQVRLGYTTIAAPISGTVDVRAARQGEVVNIGQAIVTLVDPDDLWVRADIEEGYIDRIHLGDKMTIRLPSGAEREGTVFFRGVDADYATQRDVSRTKRDIKTFEVRLRCDNKDRSLALGMSAYVLMPL